MSANPNEQQEWQKAVLLKWSELCSECLIRVGTSSRSHNAKHTQKEKPFCNKTNQPVGWSPMHGRYAKRIKMLHLLIQVHYENLMPIIVNWICKVMAKDFSYAKSFFILYAVLDICEEYDGKKCLIEEKNYFLVSAYHIFWYANVRNEYFFCCQMNTQTVIQSRNIFVLFELPLDDFDSTQKLCYNTKSLKNPIILKKWTTRTS